MDIPLKQTNENNDTKLGQMVSLYLRRNEEC